MKPSVLIISGHDPSGGAGFITDIRTASFLEVYPYGVVTNLTVQNSQEFTGNFVVSYETIKQQLKKILEERKPDAVKIGMIGDVHIVNTLVDIIIDYNLQNIILDPVLKSTTGFHMGTEKAFKTMQYRLFPRITIMTPNLAEAERMVSIPVQTPKFAKRAAGEIAYKYNCPGVIITGGHFEDKVIDTFFFDGEIVLVESDKIDGSFHGSGCVFSSALAAFIARGEDPIRAFERSHKFMQFIMKKSSNETWDFTL